MGLSEDILGGNPPQVICPNCHKSNSLEHYGLTFVTKHTAYLEDIGDIDNELDEDGNSQDLGDAEGDFFACWGCGCTFIIIDDGDTQHDSSTLAV